MCASGSYSSSSDFRLVWMKESYNNVVLTNSRAAAQTIWAYKTVIIFPCLYESMVVTLYVLRFQNGKASIEEQLRSNWGASRANPSEPERASILGGALESSASIVRSTGVRTSSNFFLKKFEHKNFSSSMLEFARTSSFPTLVWIFNHLAQ